MTKFKYNDIIKHKVCNVYYTIDRVYKKEDNEQWYGVVEGCFNCLVDTLLLKKIRITAIKESDIILIKRIFN